MTDDIQKLSTSPLQLLNTLASTHSYELNFIKDVYNKVAAIDKLLDSTKAFDVDMKLLINDAVHNAIMVLRKDLTNEINTIENKLEAVYVDCIAKDGNIISHAWLNNEFILNNIGKIIRLYNKDNVVVYENSNLTHRCISYAAKLDVAKKYVDKLQSTPSCSCERSTQEKCEQLANELFPGIANEISEARQRQQDIFEMMQKLSAQECHDIAHNDFKADTGLVVTANEKKPIDEKPKRIRRKSKNGSNAQPNAK